VRPVAVIGNLSRDVVDGGSARIGGAPFYAARALRLLGRRAVIVTKGSPRALVALGVPVVSRPARATAAFTIANRNGGQELVVEEIGDVWTPEEARGWVADAIRPAVWIHVAPLLRSDFPAETLAELSRGKHMSLDGQGLVRAPRTGPLQLNAEFDPELLRHVDVLKLAEKEALALVGKLDEGALRSLGVPEVVVTRGAAGSIVLADHCVEDVPARPVPGEIDSTGAGDAFAAVYLASRSAGHSPSAAARQATALVGGLLAGRVS
jgi:sugar/nucleoside kinase (ribokinase family)